MAKLPSFDRLSEGLAVLALALQHEQRQQFQSSGVSAMQAAILAHLLSHAGNPQRVKDIAMELGVSQPTMTVSINNLVEKGIIKKVPDPADARASHLKLTPEGRKLAREKPLHTENIQAALASLGDKARGELMVLLTATIRALQVSGAIVPQRQCISCRHFRAYVHKNAGEPHHCNFVNAAFGNAALRFQCSDHETAKPADQSANWSVFKSKAESLRAT
jgi:DNA-binding MarR family transcriptional regulator